MMRRIVISLYILIFLISDIYSQEINGKINSSNTDRFQLGGFKSFKDYLSKSLVYPNNPNGEQLVSGVLLAGLILAPNGEIVNVFTLNSLSAEIDNQTLDIFESTSGFWKPLQDSITSRKNAIIIIPIVFSLKNTEIKVQRDNFKLKLEDDLMITMFFRIRGRRDFEQVSDPNYLTTNYLMKKCEKLILNENYKKAHPLLIRLIQREPFNTDFYTKLIAIENKLGDTESACKNLKFVQTYLIQQPDNDKVGKIICN